MPQTKPALRFQGFTDEWEQKKLGDEATELVAGGDIEKSLLLDEGKYPVIANALTGDGIVGYYATSYRIKAPAVTVTGRGDVGHAKARTVDFTPVVRLLSMKSKHDVYFLENAINRLDVVVESTGVPQLTVPQLAKYEVMFPPNHEEEEQIGTFFTSLDTLISLHQRKYTKLVNTKKSMLEKMFPKNGANVPEVRFAGFTGEWERRKLGEIYGTIRNAFVGTATPYYVDDGHFYLESNNVKDGQINRNNEVFINEEFYQRQKDKWLHTGDMVMVQSGHVGHSAVIPESLNNTAAHALIIFTDMKVTTDPYFLNYEYQTDIAQKQISDITKGNTIKHILSSDMKKFTVVLPSLDEQKKIATFFASLDELIAQQQCKVEKLQRVKKSCLEKMFV